MHLRLAELAALLPLAQMAGSQRCSCLSQCSAHSKSFALSIAERSCRNHRRSFGGTAVSLPRLAKMNSSAALVSHVDSRKNVRRSSRRS